MKSIHGNACCQIFLHKVGFAAWYPKLNAKGGSLGNTLDDFVQNFGAPEHLTFDDFHSQVGNNTKFFNNLRKYTIGHHIYERCRPKKIARDATRAYHIMNRKNIPNSILDYLAVWVCETVNLSVSSSRYTQGQTPLEVITGETHNISEYLDFGFYYWVTYTTKAGVVEQIVGRWIWVSHKIEYLMLYWVLTVSDRPISCVNVQCLTKS